MGQKWVKNGSKTRFSKSNLGPFGMLQQVFLTDLEPVVMRVGPWKLPRSLEKGQFCDQKWVKNGSKPLFSKCDPRHFRVPSQVFLAHFELVVARFGPWKIPKCLEEGPLWEQNWVKNGSKARSSKGDPGPFGLLQQVFLAEPLGTRFWSMETPKMP